jgi:DNA-binding FrmR family transcriptional regulator
MTKTGVQDENALRETFVPAENEQLRDDGAQARACCCGERRKTRSEKEYKDLLNRLSRIEGQIRGLKGMVERDAYCIDILNQASAASSALSSFCKVLLSSHIRTCVTEDVREGHEEKVDELVKTLQKMMR